MRLELPRKTLKDDLAVLPLRRIIGVACLLVASAVLTLRIQHLRDKNIVELTERGARLALLSQLSGRVLSYAEQYGRPIFMWTGVRHASAAESTLYHNLRKDLLDERIRYWYSEDNYSIAWYDPKGGRSNQLVVRHAWPPEASFYAHVRWVVNHPVPPRVRKPFAEGRLVRPAAGRRDSVQSSALDNSG